VPGCGIDSHPSSPPSRRSRFRHPAPPPTAGPAIVGRRRLDLTSPETVVIVPDDTPPPLTAQRLASVRREAGANLFSDGANAPERHAGWESWAGGMGGSETDDRIGEFSARLRRRSWWGRLFRRR
jgi:hypothetical protein